MYASQHAMQTQARRRHQQQLLQALPRRQSSRIAMHSIKMMVEREDEEVCILMAH